MIAAAWYLARPPERGANHQRGLFKIASAMRTVRQPAMMIGDVDEMSGQEFEQFFAVLLRGHGYSGIDVVGGTGDGGADIIATDPDGVEVAFQCKRQSTNVGITIVRSLLGTVSCEWEGLEPCLVTTAFLTRRAEELAQEADVRVIDRPILDVMLREVYG